MKDFLNKIQKDLLSLQKTIEREGNDLVAKAKKAANELANSKNVQAKTREIEKMLEGKFKKFEPALYKFVGDVTKNAAKYGIHVESLESALRTSVKKAKSGLQSLRQKPKTSSSKSKKTSSRSKKSSRPKSAAKKKSVVEKTAATVTSATSDTPTLN